MCLTSCDNHCASHDYGQSSDCTRNITIGTGAGCMREMSAGFECSYGKLSPHGFIKYQVPIPRSVRGPLGKCHHKRSGDLVILNSTHGVLVGMVIKPSGQVVHTTVEAGELGQTHKRTDRRTLPSTLSPRFAIDNNVNPCTKFWIPNSMSNDSDVRALTIRCMDTQTGPVLYP